MESMKPSITFGAIAVPHLHQDGYAAKFWAPGTLPGFVRDSSGKTVCFQSEETATIAAFDRLFQILNAPRVRAAKNIGKPERYERLSGPDFAALMQEANITADLFAYLYGTNVRRVFQWCDGLNEKGLEELAPQPARILLELFKDNPKNIDFATMITDAVATSRRTAAE